MIIHDPRLPKLSQNVLMTCALQAYVFIGNKLELFALIPCGFAKESQIERTLLYAHIACAGITTTIYVTVPITQTSNIGEVYQVSQFWSVCLLEHIHKMVKDGHSRQIP